MAGSNPIRLAEVGVGALRLGVPVEAVVEAVALPAATGQLPRRRGALAGVLKHGGRLVPVVDLARWVEVGAAAHGGAGAHARAGARVLVLHEAGRTVGLKVDAVAGLVEVQPGDVMRLHHDDDPEEVFHSAARAPEGGQVLSLLDAGRLARLAAAWSEDATSGHAGDDAVAAQTEAAARLYALLQLGAQQLAVPAEALSEVIPMPQLERFGGGIDSHWCRWRGRHLPVLPPAAVLPAGLPAPAGDAAEGAPLLAVIEREGLALGLPVRAALRLDTFEDAGLPAPGGIVATVYDRDGQPVQLLDAAALFARFPEAALSQDRTGADAAAAHPGAHQERDAGNAAAYIVYEADGLQAGAIDAVERILGPNDARAALRDTDGAGCMHWEGRAIPVRELRASAHAGTAPHLLLVRGADGLVACAVARVHLLIPPGGGRVYRMGRRIEFITAGEGAAQASYRIVDLAAIR